MKQLNITDPNSEKVYTLEFNRKSVLRAVKAGFDPNKMSEGDIETALMIPMLFNCAFDMHHGKMPEEETDAIYEMIPDKGKLIEALAELFAEPIEAVMSDPKGAKSKNFKWKKTW
jgi:hypothetical protein